MSHSNEGKHEGLTPEKLRGYDSFSHLSDAEVEQLTIDLIKLSTILIETAKKSIYESRAEVPTICKKES